MKKFYAFVAAALMSVSLFAQTPTQADLSGYMEDGYYVACFSTPADATCNDIVWIGTYNGWNAADPDKIACEELAGFAGWYVAKVPVVEGENSGKPVQLDACGDFDWAYQCGAYGTIELISGSVDIESGQSGAETDLKNWSLTEPTIISMSAWKNTPCGGVCDKQQYTIILFDPFCEEHPEFAPYLRGSFNNWGDAVAMTLVEDPVEGSYYTYTTPRVADNMEFKFNNNADKDNWDNQFQHLDTAGNWQSFDNFKLDPNDPMSAFYTRDGNTLTFDFWNGELYRYALCGAAPLDTTPYPVIFMAELPAGAPAAVEVIGTFDGWSGTALVENEGVWGAMLNDITAADKFKIREAGTWDNQITLNGENLQDTPFGEVWFDGADMGEQYAAYKIVYLELTDEDGYSWTSPVEGIENVVLTEKAQKVVVDGVIYIIRDNKMYNLQGTQVR